MPLLRPVLVLVLTLLSSTYPLAYADDEGSEHTATVIGDTEDTLGVSMHFHDKKGWSMDYRPKPGADEKRIRLPFMPADHAHYTVVVPRQRRPLVFVLQSREELTAGTETIWVVDATGAVSSRWTLGDLLTKKETASLPRSVSHAWWSDEGPVLHGTVVRFKTANAVLELDLTKKHISRR